MKQVKLTKIGETNKGEIPIGHWVEGKLINLIEVNKIISIIREKNSNGNRLGLFTSSPVLSYEDNGGKTTIVTANSTYLLESV